jgi:hypothetical protein
LEGTSSFFNSFSFLAPLPLGGFALKPSLFIKGDDTMGLSRFKRKDAGDAKTQENHIATLCRIE